jgi:hypothetical protein
LSNVYAKSNECCYEILPNASKDHCTLYCIVWLYHGDDCRRTFHFWLFV